MWARMRDEERRIEVLEAEKLQKLHPWQHRVLTLPMTEDMQIFCRRMAIGLTSEDRRERKRYILITIFYRKKKNRFTSAEETKEESKVEEVIMEIAYIPKRKFNPLLEGCRSIDEYDPLNKIDEGSYGIVFRAKERATGKIYAVKKVKLEREKEGFPITALREINLLLKLDHPNIVKVKEVVFGNSLDKVYVVMEYIDHEIKNLVQQSYELMTAPKSVDISHSDTYLMSTVEIK
jgi:serine/threonine protein kinase